MAKKNNARFFGTQFITALISTTLVLILLGTIVLFVFTARNLSNYVKENINVSVLLSDGLDSLSILKMQEKYGEEPFVKSIDYISKEQAMAEEAEAMGTDPTEFLDFNPFTASFEIKVNAEYANNDSLTNIVRDIKADPAVMDVIYQKDLLESVNGNIRKLSIILLVIAALFTYISFVLINNTVQLTIFSRRFIINTMKLVGASWGFIRAPFLRQGLVLGIVAAALADGVIYGGLQWLKDFEPGINAVVDLNVVIIVGTSVLVFGLLITFLCTFFSLEKYLRMNSNELYHV